jgi:hypothetical protein
MCVCVCVCVCMYIYIYIHMYMCIYIYTNKKNHKNNTYIKRHMRGVLLTCCQRVASVSV